MFNLFRSSQKIFTEEYPIFKSECNTLGNFVVEQVHPIGFSNI